MVRVLFADPFGNDFTAITVEEFLFLIETKDEAYWNTPEGSGTASLYYFSNDNNKEKYHDRSISLTMKNGIGFIVYFVELNAGRKIGSYHAISGDDFEDCVWINYAGGERQMAKALFVSHADVMAIIRVLFATGERSPEVTWIKANEVPWKLFDAYR